MSRRGRMLSMMCGIALLGLATPAVALAGSFDGTYTGKRVLRKGDKTLCPTQEDVSVTIKDGTLTFTNSALKSFAIAISPEPDGSFDDVSEVGGAVVAIRGRMVGNALDADVTNGPCQHHWHLEKQ